MVPVRLFYSYSHRDEMRRAELETHLAALRREGLLEEWHDRRVIPGGEWRGHIEWHLEQAELILLLLSADFLASDYCYEVEAQRALQRHASGEAWVIPVLLRPVDWHATPLAALQALPRDGKPVMSWRDRDQAWLEVARGIRLAVEELRGPGRTQPVGHFEDVGGTPLYLCSQFFGFTRPLRLALDQPCGTLLLRITQGLGLPSRMEHAGRAVLTLEYELLSRDRVLLRHRSLAEQGVGSGSVLDLAVRPFAAAPVKRRAGSIFYRGHEAKAGSIATEEQQAVLNVLGALMRRQGW